MEALPHHYTASADASPAGAVIVQSGTLPELSTQPPPEFGGPGGEWSPEALLAAAIADCFVLTFRAVARASGLEWERLQCQAEGVLDRDGKQFRFTEWRVHARLAVDGAAQPERAQRLLEKAEHNCLITNSLNAPVTLTTEIDRVD